MIQLNFIEITPQQFSQKIYVRVKREEKKIEGILGVYRLPFNETLEEIDEYRHKFQVSLCPKEGFTEVYYHSGYNNDLTKKLLLYALENEFKPLFSSVTVCNKRFDTSLEIVVQSLPKGNRVIKLVPYYLKSKNKLGVLINYKFNLNAGESFDKETQILSLSLAKDGKSNTEYYNDKKRILTWFAKKYMSRITLFEEENEFQTEFECFDTQRLDKKHYVIGNNNISTSQFQGLKSHGPFQKLQKPIHFLFIFEDRFTGFANQLFQTLKGKLYRGTFAGMEKMFRIPFDANYVDKILLDGYKKEDLDRVINTVSARRVKRPDRHFIAIFIEPHKFENQDFSPYYYLKHGLLEKEMPLQVINHERLGKRNALKWATSNIGLQLFAKTGGTPWIVKPSNSRCLILGIGCSHEFDENNRIKKYFTYSVCLDSSGVYKKLAILANQNERESYLTQLRTNLIALLKTDEFKDYNKCALHLPFKIRYSEIQAIQNALQEFSDIEFKVIKVNLHNKFFGFTNHNTSVPYESDYIQLSKTEYLVWFEGLQYGKENVYKRISNPVHIEFINPYPSMGTGSLKNDKLYLQDVLNLSGTNWRGFNSKLMPISIYYSQIVASYTKYFESFEAFNKAILQYNLPWFL